jgi:hypothetical protein
VLITRLLADDNFTAEQQQVLELAFNSALRKLNLVDRNDPICEIVARKIIQIAKSGVPGAVAITETAYNELVG